MSSTSPTRRVVRTSSSRMRTSRRSIRAGRWWSACAVRSNGRTHRHTRRRARGGAMTIRKMKALRLLVCLPLAACVLTTREGRAQSCTLPAVPDATITTTQDRDQMMCQLGLTFPTMPARLDDPNKPVNAWPVNAANPEGNWTDSRGHVVIRTNFGLWHTYDSDAGTAGGAQSGFGDYGPFS